MTNPSYECMERSRAEYKAKLLDLRRERVVKALGAVNLHGDSHAMLSQIAYSVHPHVGAWDAESCDHLRNVLAELIGEARDEAASGAEHRCSCGAGGCHRGDESEEVGDLSVTSELREYVRIHETATTVYTTMPPQVEDKPTPNGDELLAIADEIDEQFARVCEQQERVLQDTIEQMQGEVEKLQAKLDELERFDPEIAIAAFGDDNEELRKLLSRAARLLADAERDRDKNYHLWMDCKKNVVQSSVTIEELEEERDECNAECRMYRNMLNDAVGEYKMLDRMSAETSANFHTMRDRVWGLEAERDELLAITDRIEEQYARNQRRGA